MTSTAKVAGEDERAGRPLTAGPAEPDVTGAEQFRERARELFREITAIGC
ncbi:hypothetical protein ACWD7Y_09680 [Streptomyces drozdowiczii]